MATPFRVLAVCTGNICRSPAVERLLAVGLGAAFRGANPGGLAPAIEVGSAGVGALVGAPMTEPMAAIVTHFGGDATGFTARQLNERIVADSDLVIALTRRHRSAVVELVPSAVRRTFTLRELARLTQVIDPAALPGADATTADRLAALVPLAGAARASAGFVTPDADDVVDPYRGDVALYQKSFGQLFPAVQAIVGSVRR